MPDKIRILIIEDELIIAEDMKEKLQDLGYSVAGIACDTEESMKFIDISLPDIALVDIQLRDNDNGIELAGTLKTKYNIPVVFITSHSDRNTVEQAKNVEPEGYIVKPFEKEDLFTAIELAIFRHDKQNNLPETNENEETRNIVIKDCIFIKKDYMLIKVKFSDLKWIKAEGNYLELYCIENKHLIRSSLKNFIDKLPSELFLQVHKSFCVNISFITSVEYSSVALDKTIVPIGRSYLDHVKKVLNIDF
ncbi:MAG: response regulator [Bacteroidales bacterium]|nr:response regulator [Bacteroidales bacterium]